VSELALSQLGELALRQLVAVMIALVKGWDALHLAARNATRALLEAGTPPKEMRAFMQITAFLVVDKQIEEGGGDARQLALRKGIRAVIASGAPVAEALALWDIEDSLNGKGGRKPRTHGARNKLATFSAAVTVLKRGRRVDDVIAELAGPNGISRKDLKNFRDRLNRGLADPGSVNVYEFMLSAFKRLTKAEIKSILARR
jgi:hypothetical protein